MDNNYSDTNFSERKRDQHLKLDDRGAIQALKRQGYSNRAIAKLLNCSPSTIGYELKRGTKEYLGKGRKPTYSAKRGNAVYKENRRNSHRNKTILRTSKFIDWMTNKVRHDKWSLDTCVGYAKVNNLFPSKIIPCTKTLYNLIWKGELPLNLFELPVALKRKKRGKNRISKRLNGKSIDERTTEVDDRNTFGHWEADTVVGKKKKGEPVMFTIVERLTGNYFAFKIDSKTTEGVKQAMQQLHAEFGEKFSEVFKTITADNGVEFASFSELEKYMTEIFFAHPYSS